MSAPTPFDQALAAGTSWPEWTCITQPDESDPDTYHGECFRDGAKTSGVRSLVVAWAQDEHGDCEEA